MERGGESGGRREGFGPRFAFLHEAGGLWQQSGERHLGLVETLDILPAIVVVIGVVRSLIVVGVVPGSGDVQEPVTLAEPEDPSIRLPREAEKWVGHGLCR